MRTIVYDLDGTLVDSAIIVQDILNDMRSELGKPSLSKSDLIPWLSLGGEDLVGNALEVSTNSLSQAVSEFRRRYYLRPTPLDSVYPGVLETLERLAGESNRLALCTNKPRNLAEKVLRETGLARFFAFVSAGGDLPSKKPDRRNLDICLSYFSVSADEAVLVGDSKVDQMTAKTAGVSFVLFAGGYNDGVALTDSDRIIDHHLDILNFI